MAVCLWGIAPSEFWQMTPGEWWRMYEAKRPRDPNTDYAGSLRQEDVEALYAEMKEWPNE